VVHVCEGQIAIGVFEAAALRERRAEQARRALLSDVLRAAESLLGPAPLARVARKSVAWFGEGDVLNGRAIPDGAGGADEEALACFSTAPSVLCVIGQATVADLAAQ
jgi:hypothetical protein